VGNRQGPPPLHRDEIIAILQAAGFAFKPTKGRSPHDKYEGRIRGQVRIVLISRSYDEVSGWVLASIIKQSGMTKKEFYGLTPVASKKLGCPFLKHGLPAGVRS
jgi:predicted RNA binding protein YcfA (HicA-like mRNA interferase family)